MSGRTIYVPKDSAWWRRGRIVEIGQAHGPAGPAVIDWLTCEARTQGPLSGHDGAVKAGYASVAHGCFLPGGFDQAREIVASAVEIGLLDDLDDQGRTFDCRISGWRADVETPLASADRAGRRARAGQAQEEPSGNTRQSPDTPGTSRTFPDNTGQVARELFGYWQQTCNHPQAKPTRERLAKIAARLKENYSVEQIRQAIDGAARSPYVDEAGKRHDDLTLICRTGSKLEDFIDRASGPAAEAPRRPVAERLRGAA